MLGSSESILNKKNQQCLAHFCRNTELKKMKNSQLNPNALTPEQLAMLLTKGIANRWRVTAQQLAEDLESGYSAWLLIQQRRQHRS